MKILFLTPRLPYPPLKGDQVVAYHRLRTLSPRHDITLLTFVDGHEDPQTEDALLPFCSRIVKIPLRKCRIAWNLVSRGPWSKLPLQLLYYRSPAYQKALQRLLYEDFQIVHAFTLRILSHLEGLDRPIVLDCIDSMRLNMSRQIQVSCRPKRWVYQEELRRLNRYEPSIGRLVERVIFVSPIDEEASGSQRTMVLPLGVGLPTLMAPGLKPIVAFSGNMGYAPNIKAVEWFVHQCWSVIRQFIPDATFRVLGRGAPASILALQAVPGVEIIGRIEDMMSELLKVSVSVAPMQSGSGMQFKILEAMACGLPVVTTTLGLGAINAKAQEEVVIRDLPGEFAIAVINLLNNPEKSREIGDRARSFVEKAHSWETTAKTIDDLYIVVSKKA